MLLSSLSVPLSVNMPLSPKEKGDHGDFQESGGTEESTLAIEVETVTATA
jgi:hypothetical protein